MFEKIPLKKWAVEIELVEDMLGTIPHNKDVFSHHVAATALERAGSYGTVACGTPTTKEALATIQREEEGCIQDLEEKGWTGFMKDAEGKCFIMNYMVRGNLRSAAEVIGEEDKNKNLKSKVTKTLFVLPRRLYPQSQEFFKGIIERPLRTGFPERTCVARSDLLMAGARLKFEIHLVGGKVSSGISGAMIQRFLSYGGYMGLGQWRSGGYGAYELKKFDANVEVS